MRLYHASDRVIETPDVYHSREHLDFGKGFTRTSGAFGIRQSWRLGNIFIRLSCFVIARWREWHSIPRPIPTMR